MTLVTGSRRNLLAITTTTLKCQHHWRPHNDGAPTCVHCHVIMDSRGNHEWRRAFHLLPTHRSHQPATWADCIDLRPVYSP